MAGVPAGGGALVSGAGAVPRVGDFAGAARRVAGGAAGADGEFLPASALGGVAVLGGTVAGAAGFFPAGPRGYPTGTATPEFPSLVKSGGLVPGGLSPYVCFCSWPNA